jgi:hypothetical protein
VKRLVIVQAAVAVLLLYYCAQAQPVDRSRDEGTSSIRASNVMGNGNITGFLTGSADYSLDGFLASPCVGGAVGITDIMELTGQIVPVTSKGIGPIEAHLQITTPANDKLRFLGVAVLADLFLSTVKDTISQTSAKDKPEYNSYPTASMIVDLDWLAWKKWLPFKTYAKLSFADNPDLLYRYDQVALMSAIEWKMFQHSLFCGVGMAMYKEKQSMTFGGDQTYAQRYAWIEPGARYRLFSRFSILGSVKMTLYQDVKDKSPLKPELFNASLRIEAPIFFRETNTEAIRTLIFMQQKKERKSEAVADAETTFGGKNLLGGIAATGTDADSLGSFDFSQERQDLVKRREDTQKKMVEIEKLFIELDKEDSLKAVRTGDVRQSLPPTVQPDSNEVK